MAALKGFTNIAVGLSESFRFWHIDFSIIPAYFDDSGKEYRKKVPEMDVKIASSCTDRMQHFIIQCNKRVVNRSKVCMKWS